MATLSAQIANLNEKIETITKKMDNLPLVNGSIDYQSPEIKRLSNKRARLYEDIRDLKRGKNYLEYCENTETLRLLPQNYMLANFSKCYWILDSDGAINLEFLQVLTAFFYEHENKFSKESWKKIDLGNIKLERS